LAKRGARKLDSAEEKIKDEGLAGLLRKKAAKIHATALVAAILITVLCFLVLPVYIR
jgi:hypothetical protein